MIATAEPKPELKFDPETHIYTLGDRRLVSVTQVLRLCGFMDFLDHINPDVLEKKRKLGTAVHAAAHFYDKGTLNPETVHPKVMPYLEGWKKFLAENKVSFDGMEEFLYHPTLYFAGTYDRKGFYNGARAVMDIKTYEPEAYTGLQLAGYELLVRSIKFPLWKRIAVYLRDDGTYKIRFFEGIQDLAVFQACLTVAQWKFNNGGKINE